MIVKLTEVLDAIESSSDEAVPYLDLATGRIILVMDEYLSIAEAELDQSADAEECHVPEWAEELLQDARRFVQNPDSFTALPTKREFNEWRVMERFVLELDNEAKRQELLNAIHGKGAFRHFKDTAARLGLLEMWYTYRDYRLRDFAQEWCEDEGLAYG